MLSGVIVSYKTIRQWCAEFGPEYAAGLRATKTNPATSGGSTRCS